MFNKEIEPAHFYGLALFILCVTGIEGARLSGYTSLHRAAGTVFNLRVC